MTEIQTSTTGSGPLANTSPISGSGQNPFELVAYILFAVRHSLEDKEEADRARRWVRMSRIRHARDQGVSGALSTVVKAGLEGFAEALMTMLQASLWLKEELVSVDAAKALLEATLDLVQAVSDENFKTGIESITKKPVDWRAMGKINEFAQNAEQQMGSIPDPKDVEIIGRELYRLLCVVFAPGEAMGKPPKGPQQVDLAKTGKIWLIHWALNAFDDAGITNRPLAANENEAPVLKWLGARSLGEATPAHLPGQTTGTWAEGGEEDVIFEKDLLGAQNPDIGELKAHLTLLGYVKGSLKANLEDFQVINELPKTGVLDTRTMNRLLSLDFDTKNIERPRPFASDQIHRDLSVERGELKLINPDADDPSSEKAEVDSSKGYSFYLVGVKAGTKGPEGWKGGWLYDSEDNAPRFAALQSRRLIQDQGRVWYDYQNGRACAASFLSEGEADSGKYFFAAASSEPWLPGRCGKLVATNPAPLYSAIPQGTQTRLYQWVDLKELQGVAPDKLLRLTVIARQRSLYKESSGNSKAVDNGRIGLEVHDMAFKANAARPESALLANQTEWFPGSEMVAAAQSMAEAARKHLWSTRATWVLVPPADRAKAKSLLVMLEGTLRSGEDIDAYFDNIQVRWEVLDTE